jgi:hypothetical protein
LEVVDKTCVQECPADCIYFETDLPEDQLPHLADNAAFFTSVLPGRDAPLGVPGGAASVGPVGTDTPLVASLPVR